jgi:hypothetical protein
MTMRQFAAVLVMLFAGGVACLGVHGQPPPASIVAASGHARSDPSVRLKLLTAPATERARCPRTG